jgi:hypothetical protein
MVIRLKDPEKAREQGRQYDIKRNPKRTELHKKRRREDPVYAKHIRDIETKSRNRDPEKRKALERDRYANNSERECERKTQYRREHPKQIKYTSITNFCKKNNMALDISCDEAYSLFDQQCYYCGVKATPETPNGLDRKDAIGSYIKANVVTCCRPCNMGKADILTPDQFIHHATHLALMSDKTLTSTSEIRSFCRNSNIAWRAKINKYRSNASKKSRPFTLSDETCQTLFQQPCHYCHGVPIKTSGLDRVNNNLGYINSNVVPCCWTCNRMKYQYPLELFMERCKHIALTHKLAYYK